MQILQIDYNSKSASLDFTKSLKETGFAVIKNHPINHNLITDVFKEWEIFFASEYKNNYIYNNTTQDGLFPIKVSEKALGYSIKDLKEFFHYYPWGQYPKELSNKTKILRDEMNSVAVKLLVWLEEHLPREISVNLSEPLTNMIEGSEQILMRILHYPPLSGYEEEGAIRAAPHSDINLLTLLVAPSQAGLQLKDSNGNWVEVPIDKGMIAINIGDMLEEATNGFYKSTLHRVINPTDDSKYKSRYSIPLFLHARPDVILSNRYTAEKYLDERLKAIGVKKL